MDVERRTGKRAGTLLGDRNRGRGRSAACRRRRPPRPARGGSNGALELDEIASDDGFQVVLDDAVLAAARSQNYEALVP